MLKVLWVEITNMWGLCKRLSDCMAVFFGEVRMHGNNVRVCICGCVRHVCVCVCVCVWMGMSECVGMSASMCMFSYFY